MIGLPRVLAASLVLPLSVTLPLPARAQTQPAAGRDVRRGAVSMSRPVLIGRSPHHVFGSIVSIRGSRFSLRTRSGRMLIVDDSVALARGTFSAPLFAGKIVVVAGEYDTLRVLHALTVTRQPRIDRTTPSDT